MPQWSPFSRWYSSAYCIDGKQWTHWTTFTSKRSRLEASKQRRQDLWRRLTSEPLLFSFKAQHECFGYFATALILFLIWCKRIYWQSECSFFGGPHSLNIIACTEAIWKFGNTMHPIQYNVKYEEISCCLGDGFWTQCSCDYSEQYIVSGVECIVVILLFTSVYLYAYTLFPFLNPPPHSAFGEVSWHFILKGLLFLYTCKLNDTIQSQRLTQNVFFAEIKNEEPALNSVE